MSLTVPWLYKCAKCGKSHRSLTWKPNEFVGSLCQTCGEFTRWDRQK